MAGTAQPFHKSITGYDMSSDKPIAAAMNPTNSGTSSDVFIFFIVGIWKINRYSTEVHWDTRPSNQNPDPER